MYNDDNFDKIREIKEMYPDIFKDCFDFSVGSGWLELVEILCHTLNSYQKFTVLNSEKGESTDAVPNLQIKQIKEKFGGLRFYISGADETVYGMIRLAEEIASRTCERCGSKVDVTNSEMIDSGWRKTLCFECHKQ